MPTTASAAHGNYTQLRRVAYNGAIADWKRRLGIDLTMWDWGRMASDSCHQTWTNRSKTSNHWDWDEIHARHTDYDRLPLAVFGPNGDLWIAGLALMTSQAVHFRFLEGTPDPACPIASNRAFIALDVAARYGQALGKTELLIQPANPALEAFYRERLKFTHDPSMPGGAFYRRGL